jgi:cytochrome c-type biogenesis protein CcmH
MSIFVIAAALMAAFAAAIVAFPLLRDKKSRAAGALAAVLVAGAAAALYPLWSNWDWNAPLQPQETAVPAPDVLAMVAKLEQRLRENPNELAGWLMLGKSYVALQRLDDAVAAYERRGHPRIGRGPEPSSRRTGVARSRAAVRGRTGHRS